jgi:L-ascorbate metabolism protein UlaG (beta-lactamase superfamily)
MQITWLNHAAFKIKTNSGALLYLDPYQISDDEKADVIIISHTHGDHFSKSDIKKIWKDDTILIGPKSIERNLEKFNGKTLNIGEKFSYKDFQIELVPAYTIKKSTHPKDNEWSGTIIESEGKIVYHAGDTEKIPEMQNLSNRKVTVALLPCGGTYTMDFEEATDAAMDIKPEILVPMHTWGADLNKFKKMMNEKDPSIRVEILENKSLEI